MLNPVHLRTLLTVMRTGSFADAGRRLGYTGSAVSQQISALERQLKADLFERDAHSVRPTAAAEFIAARASAALGSLQSLEDEITTLLEGSVGRLRIGSFPTASERLLPTALSSFVQRFPGVHVQLDEGEPQDLMPLLEARELDVALVYEYDLVAQSWPRGLRASTLLNEDLLLLVPSEHRLARGGAVAVGGLADETWISTREGTGMASMLRRLCGPAGFEPIVSYRSNDYDVVQALVRTGLGLALVPALGHVSAPGLSVATFAEEIPRRAVLALRSPAATLATVDGILEALTASAGQLAENVAGVSLPADTRTRGATDVGH